MNAEEKKLEMYQLLTKINRSIEEDVYKNKIIIWIFKVVCFLPFRLWNIDKELRNKFITGFLKCWEYEERKNCGYYLTEKQETLCFKVNLAISLLKGRISDEV